jgi:hypothetical protein
VAQLRVEQAHHVTPGIEAASKLLLTQIPGDLAGRVRGYHLAKLCENAKPVLGWLFSFFHTADSSQNRRNQPPILSV